MDSEPLPLFHCPHCQEPIPGQANPARYCVSCGKPVAQTCLYEEGPGATLVPLATQGAATPSCTNCGGAFTHCPHCHRLHHLDEHVCKTSWCTWDGKPTGLQEPTLFFPCQTGALDGTRSATMAGEWNDKLEVVPLCSIKGRAIATVFRYGYLFMVTDSVCVMLEWSSERWREKHRVSLDQHLRGSQKSVLVEDGMLFLLGENRGYVIGVGNTLTQRRSDSVCGLAQAKIGKHLGRVIRNETELQLEVTNCYTWGKHTVELPPEIRDVAHMIGVGLENGSEFLLAARGAGLWSVNSDSGEFKPIVRDLDVVQVAHAHGLIHCSGFGEGGTSEIREYDSGSRLVSSHSRRPTAEQHPAASFVVGTHFLCTVQDTTVLRWSHRQLTRPQKEVQLPGGAQAVLDDLLLVSDRHNSWRLLGARQRQDGTYQPHLWNIDQGTQRELAKGSVERPLFCVAHDKVVVSQIAGELTTLSTYCFS